MALPQFLRPVLLILAVMLVLALAGCTSLSDIRPWFGIDLKDENTRMADTRWQDAGTLWLGFKASFN